MRCLLLVICNLPARDRDPLAQILLTPNVWTLNCNCDSREDASATHFLLRLVPSLEPIGTVRCLKPKGKDYYKLGRLAVLRKYRKYRFGRALVLALHEWARQDAAKSGLTGHITLISHSQVPVKAFYAK